MTDLRKTRFERNDRFIELLGYYNLSVYAMAKQIGLENNRTKLYNYINYKTNPSKKYVVSDDVLDAVLKCPLFSAINRDWLFFGIGERFNIAEMNRLPTPKVHIDYETENEALLEKIKQIQNENEILLNAVKFKDEIIQSKEETIKALKSTSVTANK